MHGLKFVFLVGQSRNRMLRFECTQIYFQLTAEYVVFFLHVPAANRGHIHKNTIGSYVSSACHALFPKNTMVLFPAALWPWGWLSL